MVVETFYNQFKKIGTNMTIKKENDVTKQDFLEKDLCISIGGDSVYLRTAGFIDNPDLPLLGIDSDESRNSEALCNASIKVEDRDQRVNQIINSLQKSNFSTFLRSRAKFTTENPKNKQTTKKLILNEAFIADQDVTRPSDYRAYVDNRDMGKFKSSGMIISTGTGSGGWLLSSRRLTPRKVNSVLEIMGVEDRSQAVVEYLAAQLNCSLVFPCDSDQQYYYVREGYIAHDNSFSWRSEGYCKEIRVISEIIEGRVLIDGYYNYELEIGQQFTIKSAPENSLKCIQLHI
eukprot:403362732